MISEVKGHINKVGDNPVKNMHKNCVLNIDILKGCLVTGFLRKFKGRISYLRALFACG